YSALYAPTGLELNTPEGDFTESPGGDAWVEAITVTPAEVDMIYLMLIDNFTADNTSFNFDWDLTGVILNCQIMLPVDFVEVTGFWENEYNLISWTTGSEVNTHHFDIQRSADLQEWTSVESLSAAGFSAQHEHYSFRDFSRRAEEPYYRVKEVDVNGQAIYSETIRVQPYQQEAMTHLFPNPASAVVTFTLNQAILNPVAKIRDCKGVLLREIALVCPGGTCQLDVSDLEDGCYVFELSDSEGGELNTERFVKITDR
ncbi:MAG: hypothetical protein KDC12_05905, partial [Flavobacteriales bacterium]|nr:hypothetical protein [Flavobacteriales bacterium]